MASLTDILKRTGNLLVDNADDLLNLGVTIFNTQQARDATQDATRALKGAGTEAINFLQGSLQQARGDLQPFQQFSTGVLPDLQNMLSLEGQSDFLRNNPLFNQALERFDTDTGKFAASRGRLGAGDTREELFNNFFRAGGPLLQNQIDNLIKSALIGDAAAIGSANATTNVGSNIADIIGSIGSASAAGSLGQASATAQGVNQGLGILGPLLNILLNRNSTNPDDPQNTQTPTSGGSIPARIPGSDSVIPSEAIRGGIMEAILAGIPTRSIPGPIIGPAPGTLGGGGLIPNIPIGIEIILEELLGSPGAIGEGGAL